MPCYKPLTGYRSRYLNPSGKRGIVFSPKDGYVDMPVQIPCGRCIGCRLEHSRQWAVRSMHEASLHDNNSFITLTYSPENLPKNHSVSKDEMQRFFKRLRKEIGIKISYFTCGEYGELNNRPHYHAIIFGYDFPDKLPHTIKGDKYLYTSEQLNKCWKLGFSLIGDVTFESCAYVARYVLKKYKGEKDKKDQHYQIMDKETGEVYQQEPEFALMSRNPAIGKRWFEQNQGDTNKDFITVRGNKMKLPKYYDSKIEQIDSDKFQQRKGKRKAQALKQAEDNTPERLQVKERVKIAQTNQLKRGLENDN